MPSLNEIITDNTIWNFNAPDYPTAEYLCDLICIGEQRPGLQQIMPVFSDAPEIIIYENCEASLYAATRRQCTATPKPDDIFLNNLEGFCQKTLDPEIDILLQDFYYSFPVWYNHLTLQQQKEIDRVDRNNLSLRIVNMFCKSEKQLRTGNVKPKNRSISAMNAQHKFVMGPVVYSLEQYFKNFKGYGGGISWTELGNKINNWKHRGLTKLIQFDVSGMDRSVSFKLKNIAFRVYRKVKHRVNHLDDLKVFDFHAFAKFTKIMSKTYDGVDFGYTDMYGTVFSGSSDTTLLNTIITCIMIRYTMEELLGLSPNDYDFIVKGDDSSIAVNPTVLNCDIRNAFAKSYYMADDIKSKYAVKYAHHGCGMVMKFLEIGQLDDMDFCSTNCFECVQCKTFHITRKLDRFVYLTPWSESALTLNNNALKKFKNDLYLANLKWCDGLPIFSVLNNTLKNADFIVSQNLNGKPKKHLPLTQDDEIWYNKMFNKQKENEIVNAIDKFGKALAYKLILQDATISKNCAESYCLWLNTKYGLTQEDLTHIHEDIELINNEGVYDSPLLRIAFTVYEKRKELLSQ